MAPRKQSAPPVEIVLTEADLDAIIRESLGRPRPEPAPEPAPGGTGTARDSFAAPPAVAAGWSRGPEAPGAVGDAIRMILEATTLDRGRRPRLPGGS